MNKFLRLLVKIIFFIIIVPPALIFSIIGDVFTIIIFYIINYCINTIYNFGFNKPFVSIKEFIEYMEDLDFLDFFTVTLINKVFDID